YNTNINMTAINDHPTSKNNTFWLNYFYASGFNQTLNNSGCYNKMGNYYTDYDTLILAQHECALQVPSLSIDSYPTSMSLYDTSTISCSGSDDLNETSLELSIGGTNVCTNAPSGLLKSASCAYDYKANSLGNIEILCTYTDKATNLVTQTNTFTVRAGSGPTGSSGGGGSGSNGVIDISNKSQTTQLQTKQISNFKCNQLDYTIIIEAITNNSAAINIDNKIKDTIQVKQSKEFDLNNDGVNDIKITLNKILLNKADITVEKLEGGCTEQKEETPVNKTSLLWLWSMLIIVIIVGLYLFLNKKKH
ncbi:MAG: hypothetical protein KKD48_05350, partial [Nanoarchaeota archaeon]|nr:hypothetical protein [Nanoarchaeota archaeon]